MMNKDPLGDRIDQLSPAKRALLEKLLRQKATSATIVPVDPVASSEVVATVPANFNREVAGAVSSSSPRIIPKRASDQPAPLSFGQQRLWFLDQLDPGNPFYNVSAAARLDGPLDGELLRRALNTVVERHESLRTTFPSQGGAPWQSIAAHMPPPWQEVDLTGLSPDEAEHELNRLAAEEAMCSFELTRGPLVRAILFRLGPQRHVLQLVLHHIVCDGWSLAVLRHEMALLYDAFRHAGHKGLQQGAGDLLPPLRLQYADFAAWQRNRIDNHLVQSQLEYWRGRLQGSPPWLELPLDLPRPVVQTFHGAAVRQPLSASVSAALRRLSRQENVTLFMTLIAAWQVLLARLSGGRDIWVGTPIAGRIRAELEPLIGFFVNTLVLRSEIDPQASFRQLLAEVRQHTLDAFAHQELPFEKLVEAIQPERDLSRTPLFQTMFVLQNAPVTAHRLADLSIADIELGHVQSANFDLTLNVSDGEQLDLLLVYNRDLFYPGTARRILSTFETLLGGIVRGSERPLGLLPLLDTAERRRQLIQWNTAAETKRAGHLAQAFSEQAARTPDAIAIEMDHVRWTYAELDQRANQIGHYLQQQGSGPGTAVGLCLERCPELFAALLGILKADAAYVPLDPAWPATRLQAMASDARIRHILSHTPAAKKLGDAFDAPGEEIPVAANMPGVQVVCLDKLPGRPELPITPPVIAADPQTLANVIFTSGSTGRPKGVEVRHAGLVNHARVMIDAAKLGPGDRLLQYLSLSFDAAAEEFFPALLSGATLVLHANPLELSGEQIMDWTRERRVNLVHMPPSVWSQVYDLVLQRRDAAGHLKAFLTGGDALATPQVRRWLEQTGVPIIYAYGVTEASITSTLFIARDAQQLPDRDRLPIGRPIAGNEAYILDANLQPLPTGVVGELVLGGVGVARGYCQQPQLTSERFVPHPFQGRASQRSQLSENPQGGTALGPEPSRSAEAFDPGQSRVYRTGDLARYLPDGNIEFLGRMDHQVKIRGYRIELGDVESALLCHPALAECAVIAREDQPGRKRLVAYYVLKQLLDGAPEGQTPAPPSVNELLEHLEQHLPAYMLPAAFVAIEKLPREHHGRVARERLPAPDTARPALRQSYVPPQTDVEQSLVRIWGEVLHVSQVGRHDNFFELGGDSILTIQVIARAAAGGLRLTPKQLFLNQTIAELAQVAGTGPEVIAPQGPIAGPVTLTPIQHEFLAQRLIDPHHFNQAVLLTPSSELSPSLVDGALRRLVTQHDALRLRLALPENLQLRLGDDSSSSSGIIQEILPLEECPLDDLLWRFDLEQEPQKLGEVVARVQASLDLGRPPLLRAAWIRLSGNRGVRLLIAIHHLAVDAVSWRILLEDLQVLCGGMLHTLDPPLPAKTSNFQDWARRLTAEAASPQRQHELAYWLEILKVPGALPADRPSGSNRAGDVARVAGSLSVEETTSLLQETPTAYRTQIHETLLAALAMTLASWTGFRRWRIELEGHGRADLDEQYDLSRTVGWFTTLFPVQLRAVEPDDPRQTLVDIKESMRQVPDGGLGFGLLRWLSSEERVRHALATTAREPAALCFNYLGQFDQTLPPGALFSLAKEDVGPLYAADNVRRHQLELVAHILGGQLHVEWVYSHEQYHEATIAQLSDAFLGNLRKLIAHCQSPEAGAVTPSDFPLAQLDHEDLESLSALLGDEEDDFMGDGFPAEDDAD